MGRPSTYSAEIAERICDRIANGENVLDICAEPGMPDHATIYRWMGQEKSFGEAYARARERQAEHYAASIDQLAREPLRGTKTITKSSPDGTVERIETITGDNVERTKLMIDARKWLASKYAPKRYGERIDASLTGPDGGPIEFVTRSILDKE